MKHIMIDIETMGGAPTGAIFSIGWCEFPLPLEEPEPYAVTNINVFLESSIGAGMTTDTSTEDFWRRPENAEALEACRAIPMTLPRALAVMAREVPWKEMLGVWSRAPAFDFSILNHAFGCCKMDVPWHFRQQRCQRTVLALCGQLGLTPSVPKRAGPKHTASGDAEFEAHCLAATFAEIQGQMRGELSRDQD